MAPGYRNSTRRQNRSGLVDHDIFEGLPVRQWRRGLVTVEPSTVQENSTQQNNIWAVELPHGMPKDSHLLPQHSQDLLRAARSGKVYRRPVLAEDEEVDSEVAVGDKVEKKDESPQDHGFIAKAWKQVPRHLEGPDVEFLAKRRKGLITATEVSNTSTAPPLVKTIVKRFDAVGNEYVQEVFIPLGKQAEGEAISVISNHNTTIEGFTNPNPSTLPKRKGPFRKKIKLVGRGRKKKLIPPTSTPNNSIMGSTPNSQANDDTTTEHCARSTLANNEDTEMGEDSVGNSEDGEAEEGEDNEEEDDLIDNQNLLNSAAKIILDSEVKEKPITDTITRNEVSADSERISVESGIKNENTNTSSLNSLTKSQSTAIIFQVTETTFKSDNIGKDDILITPKVLQTPHKAMPYVQTTILPMEINSKPDTSLQAKADLNTESIEISANNGTEIIHLNADSGSQMIQEIPKPDDQYVPNASQTQSETPIADLVRRENCGDLLQE